MDDITRLALEYKAVVVGAWLIVMLVAERLLPAVQRRGGWTRILRNIALWALNSGFSVAVIVPVSAWAASGALNWRPGWLGGWPGLLLDLLVLDFLIYWWHRANHAVPVLWRFHEIHHLDEFLDVTSAVRFHFGEVLLSAGFRVLVVLALDIPLSSILVFESAILIAASFHHSNLKIPLDLEQVMARVVITPSIHWVHHHAKRADTDSNYGTVLSLWDSVFASRSRTVRFPGLVIGVEEKGDVPITTLIAQPFLPRQRL